MTAFLHILLIVIAIISIMGVYNCFKFLYFKKYDDLKDELLSITVLIAVFVLIIFISY